MHQGQIRSKGFTRTCKNLLLLSVTSNLICMRKKSTCIVDFYGSDIDKNVRKVQLEILRASYDQVMGDTKDVRLSDVLEFFRQLSKPVSAWNVLRGGCQQQMHQVKGHFQHFVVLKPV